MKYQMFGSSITFSEDKETDRSAQWYQAQYGTGPLGQTWMMGSFGPDFGIGEQGVRYQSVDPLTGSFVSYSVTSPGMGIGGPFAGYGGMFSPAALASYGPFAYGNNPQPMPTPGYTSQGYTSGSAFGNNTNFYQIQPAFGLMGGLFGGLGFGLGGLYSGIGGWGFPGYNYGLYSGIGRFGFPGFGFGFW
jgi:hypothetical protein